MADDNQTGNAREVQAMTLNLKEQRVLQKRLQTLDLEKSFAMKNINMDKKQIKVFQKRLVSNVGKIKSHLSADDVRTMMGLEAEGKFKTGYTPIYLSTVSTINAAAKRLKLLTNKEIYALTEEDFKTSNKDFVPETPRSRQSPVQNEDSKSNIPSRTGSAKPGSLILRNKRSRSLPPDASSRPPTAASRMTSHVTPTPVKLPSVGQERSSDFETVGGFRSESRTTSHVTDDDDSTASGASSRPVSSRGRNGVLVQSVNNVDSKPPRPVTTAGYLTARPRTSNLLKRPKTTIGTETVGSINYSSHKTLLLKEANAEEKDGRSGRRISVMSSSSLGSEMAKEKAQEVRQSMLNVQHKREECITEKRREFLTRITQWVRENPCIVIPEKPKYAFMETSELDALKKQAEEAQVIKNEGLYTEEDNWKDLKKCRYLRMADDKIDLSGINTLAKDQIHLFGSFRIDYAAARKPNNGASIHA